MSVHDVMNHTPKQELFSVLQNYLPGNPAPGYTQIIVNAIEQFVKSELAMHDGFGTQATYVVSDFASEILQAESNRLKYDLAATQQMLDAANKQLQQRFTRCTYCGFRIDYFAEDGHDKALEEMRLHALNCPSDPHVQEISKLKEQRENFIAAGNRSNLQLGVCYQAANGDLNDLTPNDPGWSKSYKAVLDLRREYDHLMQEKAERDSNSATVSTNVSKPIITKIPDGWESAQFSKPDNARNIEIKMRSGEVSEGFYDGIKWFFKRTSDKLFDTYTFPYVLCWREIDQKTDTVSTFKGLDEFYGPINSKSEGWQDTNEFHKGDKVLIKGEVVRARNDYQPPEYDVRTPEGGHIWVTKEGLVTDK